MSLEIISGIECVRIIGREKGLEESIDVLQTTEHHTRYKEDLSLAKEMGIRTLRIGVPWHLIEDKKGSYDWTWMDSYMEEVKRLQIDPILDPLHHVSIPSWLEGGFLSPHFYHRYCLFFMNVVNRYRWVKKYTIVNEPLVTTYFATHEGIWYPFATGAENFEKGLDNIYRVIYDMSLFLKTQGKQHWYVDPSEYHYGTCSTSKEFAEYKNNSFRFTLLDRLLLQDSPAFISVLGLDYYAHCEFEWSELGRQSTSSPVGFPHIAREYFSRYNLPIAMTETNIRGTVEERLNWFKITYKWALELEKEGILRYYCWYPLIDSTDWCSLVTKCNRNIDPQGIIWLDKELNRYTSEFSDTIRRIIKGEMSVEDIPDYPYTEYLQNHLAGFLA